MNRSAGPGRTTETIVGVIILAGLAAIAVAVLVRWFHYEPPPFLAAPPTRQPVEAESQFADILPAGLSAMTSAETFDPDSLSDKIDGKAELYLAAGVAAMRSQRFLRTDAPQEWAELFVYDMGDARRAFAVYSSQLRQGAEKINLARFAYRSGGAVFFAHGRYYVEIIPSSSSVALAEAIMALGRNFVAGTRIAGGEIPELAMFPTENLQADSISLQVADAFAFERLDNVFTAAYRFGDEEVAAFISARRSEGEADRLADAYHKFMLANGARDVAAMADIPGSMLMEMLGSYELVFSRGRFLAGVHESPSRALAEKLAVMLHRRLAEAGG